MAIKTPQRYRQRTETGKGCVYVIMPMNNWTATLMLALFFMPHTVFVYRRRHGRYAKRIRAWRRRLAAIADKPFHLRLLTTPERGRLIGRGGLTSDEWFRAAAADFVAGRREHMPTCGDYLNEFGRRPRVRPGVSASRRTPGESPPSPPTPAQPKCQT